MAHNIDSSKGFSAFVSYGEPAWHGLGKLSATAISAEDALQKGGLDFLVRKEKNVQIIPGVGPVADHGRTSYFTYRTDTNFVLGTMLGSNYTVMQNKDALSVVDKILSSGTATIETAGALDHGRKVFICLKINADIMVSNKDVVKQYVLIATGHDGRMATVVMPTNVRVVCNNTLSAALSEDGKSAIVIRHTSSAMHRLNEASKVLRLIKENTEINAENYGIMAQNVISKEQMFDYFGNVFLAESEIKELRAGNEAKKVLGSRKQNILSNVIDFANNGVGQSLTMNKANYTMWSAYNAVTGYVTRKNFASENDRADSLLFGSSASIIHDAGVLALNPNKIQTLRRAKFDNIILN